MKPEPMTRVGQKLDEALSAAEQQMPSAADPVVRRQVLALTERRQRPTRWWRIATPLCAAAALTAALWWNAEPSPLGYEMEGPVVSQGPALQAEAEARFVFTDGSTVKLSPRTRIRFEDVNARGATLTLLHGSLSVDVHHGTDTSWQIAAGPMRVAVHGTRFDVAWDSAAQIFELQLHKGSVSVNGPAPGQTRRLQSGDSVEVHLAAVAGTSLEVKSGDSGEGLAQHRDQQKDAEAADGALPNAADRGAAKRDQRAAAARVKPAGGHPGSSWKELARESRYTEALRAAERQGLPTLMQQLSPSDLLYFADTARLAGQANRAEKALLLVRTNHGGTPQAALAAYSLGTLSFGQRPARAAEWFRTYLSEAPSGSLAGEALGRQMEAETKAGNQSAAKSTARRYLERYPGGPHADVAQQLVE